MEMLTLATFLFCLAVFAVVSGVRLFRDERARRRIVKQWKERMRARAMFRVIQGGRDAPPRRPPRPGTPPDNDEPDQAS